MRTRRQATSTIGFVLISLIATTAIAVGRAPSGTIAGRVVDATGAILAGATVTAVDVGTSASVTTTTDGRGRYVLAELPIGTYSVAVALAGFRRLEVRPVDLHVDDVLALDFRLEPAVLTEEVRVEAPALRSQTAAVGTVVTREFIENLPLNGRSFHSLLELTPGVVLVQASATSPGQFSVNGQRSNANYFTVDGVSANVGSSTTFGLGNGIGGTLPGVTATGGTSGLVSVDALEEFRVQTSTYAPEFGRSPGANVSVVTRAGTNALHGTLFDYVRNDALDATDWFINRGGGSNPPLRQNDFGGVVGGPVRRNEVFFFLSYEGLRLRVPQAASVTVPSLSVREAAPSNIRPLLEAFPVPNGRQLNQDQAELSVGYSNESSLDATSLRLDHRASDIFTLFGRFSHAPSSSVARQSASLSTRESTTSNLDTATIGATLLPSSRVMADLRTNYTRSIAAGTFALDDFGGAKPFAPSLFVPAFASADEGLYIGAFTTGGIWRFGKNATNPLTQVNAVGTLGVVAGAHHLKFGTDYRSIRHTNGVRPYYKAVFFASPTAANNGLTTLVTVQSADAITYRFTNASIFAQDTWRPASRLTVTFGVRWDYNPPPTASDALLTVRGLDGDPQLIDVAPAGTELWRPSKLDFAPRLGASYVVPGTELTVRGGLGIFYDLGYGIVGGGSLNNRLRNAQNTTYPLPSDVEAPIPPLSGPPYGSLSVARPDLELPRVLQWNAAIEHRLMPGVQATVTLLGADGRRLIRQKYLLRPNEKFGSLNVATNDGKSDYRALQVQVQSRPSHGVSAMGSYTWSRARDNVSTDFNAPVIPSALYEDEYGPADFDIRHAGSVAFTWGLPGTRLGRLGNAIFSGWSVDGVIRTRSAPPVNVATRVPIPGFQTASLRPDIVPGQPFYVDDETAPGGRRLNRAAFVAPPSDRQGQLGRNALRGFGAAQWDMSLRRDVKIQSLMFQWRVDVFNVTNTPNFGPPTGDLDQALFGFAQQMLGRSLGSGSVGVSSLYQIGGPRSIQLSLKVLF
jgi:hypothetical protein